MNYRIIVAHPHKQHSFQLATALEKKGVLFAYATTVYQKEKSITAFVSRFLKGAELKKAESRKCQYIPDDKVKQICEPLGLLYLVIMRLVHDNKKYMDPLDRYIAKRFGKKLAKYAKLNNVDAVICYDTQSAVLFEELKKNSPHTIRILDVSAANLLFLKKIYEYDMKVNPQFSGRLKSERPLLFSNDSNTSQQVIEREIRATNYFLVPSDFVRESLIYSGIDNKAIKKCPYGIKLDDFAVKEHYCEKDDTLRFVYVGGIKQLKGIGYLLEAFDKVNKNDATLTIVGAGNMDDPDIKKYQSIVDFRGQVLHSEIPALLQEHDVFVFPSLGDSFGFAPLEAAAVGLPLIVSKYTGLSDYMEDRENGFVINPHSSDDIIEKVNWFINNKTMIKYMGNKAREMASKLTIEEYYKNVSEIVLNIIEESIAIEGKLR